MENLPDGDIEFKQWKRVKCDDGKQRTKLLDLKKEKKSFIEEFGKEFESFKEHAYRVKEQFNAFKKMKEDLIVNKDHICVQMDFSENYSIKEREEIQSAYWNPESVTLHPVVLYWCGNENVVHTSMVVVSEVLHHNTIMVQAILHKVVAEVKNVCPTVKHIHYWTDSPTSQYRNKMIFDIVSRHPEIYQVKGSWHFFEAGHGKGACDGIGGVVKRSADTAIKTGKINITCGRDFYEWGCQSNSKIKYIFIEQKDYEESGVMIEARQKEVNAVKGTLTLHSVVGLSLNEIMVRETTCICPECFSVEGFHYSEACGWKKHKTRKEKELQNGDVVVQDRSLSGPSQENESLSEEKEIREGDFVAALYDREIYIGRIEDIDDGQYEITFMEYGSKVQDCLKWPKRKDIIWVESKDIVLKVSEPVPNGKGKRLFKLTEKDRKELESLISKEL